MASYNAVVPPVLTCWKDIAQYLGKGVRTVQRWEQEFGLPVRRPNGIEHKSPVAANPGDLDDWLKTRWSARNRGKAAAKPVSANSTFPDREMLVSEMIQAAKDLRLAHRVLVAETAAAIETLIRTCAEMQEQKRMAGDIRLFTSPDKVWRSLPPDNEP